MVIRKKYDGLEDRNEMNDLDDMHDMHDPSHEEELKWKERQ